MTTIKTLWTEIHRLQTAEDACVTEYGYVKSECRYKYQMLINQVRALHETIAWLEDRGIGQKEVTK